MMAGAGPALRLLGSHAGTADPSSVAEPTWQRGMAPAIHGLEVVGEHPEATGIELKGCLKPVLTAVTVRACAVGIHLVERNRDVVIEHCHVYDNRGPGIFLDRVNLHQINIGGSHISYNRGGGVVIFGSEIRNIQIAGCDIEYNYDRTDLDRPAADIWIETRGQSVREGAIVGCTIQAGASRDGANIRLIGESAEVAHKVGLLSITGNLISSQSCQIHCRYARGVTISGNTFFSGHERNLWLEDSSNLVVSGNTFDHNPDYAKETLDGVCAERVRGLTFSGNHLAGTLHPAGAIELRDCREVSLGDNQILDPGSRGVVVRNSRNVRVASTTVVDSRGSMEVALDFERVSGCQVCNCRLDRGTAGAIRLIEAEVADGGNLNGAAR
ncbi:MAG: right-handed parallel beta-helix repeat-containing protein [Armatimonadetes bacterium]|nr:right-handed parallel beta-helix repeat-containing protein [Armatimonadota bacterium]